jgi:hypothetical protein
VIDCISVVMEEEIEHYRYAMRDLAVALTRSKSPTGNCGSTRA